MNSNMTFRTSFPAWANACVGNNGNTDYIVYSKGFSSAANLLLKHIIINKRKDHNIDFLVYPLCFNMRHSIELRLKGAIEVLLKVASLKSLNLSYDFSGSHDIGNIWFFLRTMQIKLILDLMKLFVVWILLFVILQILMLRGKHFDIQKI
ncbi:hypothetical protein [Photobacterium damselae]|uniref:hypothetical protein n=1 Tax=Photobacterium damselae TaxID=38293 RepID=UPI00370C623D